MSAHALSIALDRLRTRSRVRGVIATLLWGVAAGAGTIVAWAWLDLLLDASVAVRVAGMVASIAAMIAALAWCFRGMVQETRESALARRLDAAAGASGQIISGLDLLAQALNGRQQAWRGFLQDWRTLPVTGQG